MVRHREVKVHEGRSTQRDTRRREDMRREREMTVINER